MCLHPHPVDPVPDDTAQLAAKLYPGGHPYLRLRDTLGTLYDDAHFASLYPRRGQAAFSPWRLMLITLLQYAEDLTDRQAAAASRDRIDWKYLLSLPLDFGGIDASVLSEFRTRLVAHEDATALLFDPMLVRFHDLGLLTGRAQQRTDSTHVLAAVRRLNRLEVVGETLRHTLNVLALAAPDWLRQVAPDAWVERYGPRVEAAKIVPKGGSPETVAHQIGEDGQLLLAALAAPEAPEDLTILPAVETLRQVWDQHYAATHGGALRWRPDDELPPAAALLHSPYDVEARYTRKRSTDWVGYKVHLTETCAPDSPHLITHVVTTAAGVQDWTTMETIHARLATRDLLPQTHLVDAGYLDGSVLVEGQRRGVDVVGPVPPNQQWQAREETGYSSDAFVLDWAREQATCPQSQQSSSWAAGTGRGGTEVIRIGFAARTCGPCPMRTACTRGERRILTVQSPAIHAALQHARTRQTTGTFKQVYAARAGVEGTVAQAVAVCDLRHARYIGQAKTALQHILTAVALNLIRVAAWLEGTPLAQTRRSSFQTLMTPA